jgi:hypothetical protein
VSGGGYRKMSASSGLAYSSSQSVSSQQSALQARARPEGEPSKDSRLLQGFPAHGGRPVTAGQVESSGARRWEAADIRADGRQS